MEHDPPQVSKAMALHAMARLQGIVATIRRTGNVPIVMEIMAGTIIVGVRMDQEPALRITEGMAHARHQHIVEEHLAHSNDQGTGKRHSERLVVRTVGQDRGRMVQGNALVVSGLEARGIKEIDQAQGPRITIMAQELKSVVRPWSKRNQQDRSRCHHRSS